MKEAFDLIQKRLEPEADFFSGEPMGSLQKAYYCKGVEKAMEIVSEVEAEYKDKFVFASVCEQIMWERDVAISQLKELGYGLGEKIRKVEAEYGNGWIPCSERLPEEPEENPEFDGKALEVYLVSLKGTKYPWRAFWNGKDFTDGWSIVHPEAWMPLPEAYKPEKGE
jgi:hypothetical protein